MISTHSHVIIWTTQPLAFGTSKLTRNKCTHTCTIAFNFLRPRQITKHIWCCPPRDNDDVESASTVSSTTAAEPISRGSNTAWIAAGSELWFTTISVSTDKRASQDTQMHTSIHTHRERREGRAGPGRGWEGHRWHYYLMSTSLSASSNFKKSSGPQRSKRLLMNGNTIWSASCRKTIQVSQHACVHTYIHSHKHAHRHTHVRSCIQVPYALERKHEKSG